MWMTCVWLSSLHNRVRTTPVGLDPCQHLTVEPRLADPTAVVWKGGEDVPQSSRGIRILGTPLDLENVVAHLQETIESHRALVERIPLDRLTERLALVAVLRNVEN